MKKINILIIILLASNYFLTAQQTPQFSQRMMDMLVYNPAVVGTKPLQEIKLHSRVQWIGFADAPRTHLISYNTPFFKNSGIGGYIMSDNTGVMKRNGANISYAYHIGFENVVLSMGIGTYLSQFGFNTQKLVLDDKNDPIIQQKVKSQITPDATFGIFLHNSRFFFGGSLTHLLKAKLKTVNTAIPATQQFCITAGLNISTNPKWSLLPSVVTTLAKNYPYQAEINFRAEYMGNYLAGASYRTKDALVVMAGLRLAKNIFLTYSFDILYSRLQNFNTGSHEVVIYYEIPILRPPMFNLKSDELDFVPHWY